MIAHVCLGCGARWLPAALRYQTEKALPECPQCGGYAPAELSPHRDCQPPPPSKPLVEVSIPKEPPTLSGKGRTGNWQRVRTKTDDQLKAATVRPGKR